MARAARPKPTIWQTAAAGWGHPAAARLRGGIEATFGLALVIAFASYNAADPSLDASSAAGPANLLGRAGASLADLGMQCLGLAAWPLALLMVFAGLGRATGRTHHTRASRRRLSIWAGALGLLAAAGVLATPQPPAAWPLARGLGGFFGDAILGALQGIFTYAGLPGPRWIAAAALAATAFGAFALVVGLRREDFADAAGWLREARRARAAAAAVTDPGQEGRAAARP